MRRLPAELEHNNVMDVKIMVKHFTNSGNHEYLGLPDFRKVEFFLLVNIDTNMCTNLHICVGICLCMRGCAWSYISLPVEGII